MFNDQEKHSQKRLMNRHIQPASQRQRHGVEDARIADSPLRPEPVLEIRVRPRGGMLRCSRAANAGTAMIRGGVRVADDGREPEDRERFFRTSRGAPPETSPIGSPNG